MCGIYGVSQQTPTTLKMLPFLAWEMEDRGKDSWGCTNGQQVVKKLGKITESFQSFSDWNQCIYHTRQASQGSVSIDNAHPFVAAGPNGSIIGVHNGCIINHTELNREHKRTCEVDSQHLFLNLSEGLSMEDVSGWGAVVWMNVGSSIINFTRFNMTDFSVVELKDGEIVFCSLLNPIEKAAKMAGSKVVNIYTVKDERHYQIENGKVYDINEMKFGGRYITHYSGWQGSAYHGYESHGARRGGNLSNLVKTTKVTSNDVMAGWELCFHCGNEYVKADNELVCKECFDYLTAGKFDGDVPQTIWTGV